MEMMRSVKISLLAVDESHCISQVRVLLFMMDAFMLTMLLPASGDLAFDLNT